MWAGLRIIQAISVMLRRRGSSGLHGIVPAAVSRIRAGRSASSELESCEVTAGQCIEYSSNVPTMHRLRETWYIHTYLSAFPHISRFRFSSSRGSVFIDDKLSFIFYFSFFFFLLYNHLFFSKVLYDIKLTGKRIFRDLSVPLYLSFILSRKV